MFSFGKRLTGKGDSLSVFVPINLVRTYGLTPDSYVLVTLKHATCEKEGFAQFRKVLRKYGKGDGIIILIPKKVTLANDLKPGMILAVSLEDD